MRAGTGFMVICLRVLSVGYVSRGKEGWGVFLCVLLLGSPCMMWICQAPLKL